MAGGLTRKVAILRWAVVAAMGSRYAEGRLQFVKTLERLHGDWARYRGGSGVPASMANLYAFMESQYGMEFDTPGSDKPLDDREVDEAFRVVARELISRGLVTLR